ncbi:hypothetical protein IFM89_024544 [Coptis chinensis]|uniref:Uncharacterized protein n=1 Tax=Coptis chinensis TaxID=261450 RepID=A0A835HPU7_9MAGN|nr:hypothetical protein IFM89_024544 [Coptis chinensis]
MQFLAQKTVIYVTHQLEFLDASDLVLHDFKRNCSTLYTDITIFFAYPRSEAPLWTGFGNLAEDKKELSRQALHVLTNILSPKMENDYGHILEVFLENRGILVLFEILCFDFVGDLDVIDSCPTVVCRILIGLSGDKRIADSLNSLETITTSGRANTSDTIDASG